MVLYNNGRFKSSVGKTNETGAGDSGLTSSRDATSERRFQESVDNDEIDLKFGFERYKQAAERVGWLFNIHPTEILDEDRRLISAVDYYFVMEDGGRFKATLSFKPYFYVATKVGCENEVATFLSRKFSGGLISVEMIAKEDLDLPNHLIGLKRKYLKLSFLNITDLVKVRNDLKPIIRKNRQKEKSANLYMDLLTNSSSSTETAHTSKVVTDHMDSLLDIREYDVPYHVRVSIDTKIFVGHWYSVKVRTGSIPEIRRKPDMIDWPDLIVLAYDIETTKLPLKFPDVNTDQIMMISYMIDGQGFLITNREIISKDVEDFAYTPKAEFEGQFTVFNEENEFKLLHRFFDHILLVKPHVIVSYNGDNFDWPFVEGRAAFHRGEMRKEIGFSQNKEGDFLSRPTIHMDCLKWVKRDSYLPVGSQNLKAVAKAKLRYDPVEIDPEDMCRFASEQPDVLANYSVSDAVATYYLYMKYVHPFIFALCTILPMEPDEVLRKGSGTLCEALLMVEAFHANIIFPNKQESVLNKMTDDGHILDQETYVGGHVEALESGVFRADIPSRFRMVPEALQMLICNVKKTMEHAIVEEEKLTMDQIENFDEVCAEIEGKLSGLRDCPTRLEAPIIYHLDVGAMYPNIILTNRLQPSAMVDEVICAACDFNRPGANCQRNMPWTWRGQFMPASRGEFHRIQQQLEMEKFPSSIPGGSAKAYHELTKEEQANLEKKRLADYCRKAYKKIHVTRTEVREQTVCQRENSFYVDTVRAFRDRRYEFKAQHKVAKGKVAEAISGGDAAQIKSAKSKEVLYDSLQLAHKCILNSFYGYVMRKGARWYSMEMAGIVCHTGAGIITKARELIEQIGRPLELDTDGIWCILPASFPENFVIKTTNPKKPKLVLSYPGAMLNKLVKDEYTNDQYQELIDPENLIYERRSENSIFFEVDGPYKAMILPASKEEGKKLKKRYAVFNFDGSLAELKGFEVKRRGELQLVKIFQSSVFESFLKGSTLEECYSAVAKVADYWLDVLYSKGENLPDFELFELISENRSMSRKLEEYGNQKSTSIKTAQRLAEFLGDQMVKDAGLSCRFIIARKPEGAPVTDRAIPLAIFQAEDSICRHYLKKWLKLPALDEINIRDVLDWEYYIERFSSTIQKIITIPASLQGIANPVPRVAHPDWLHKKLLEKTDVLKQRRINEIFTTKPKENVTEDHEDSNIVRDVPDIEDLRNVKSQQTRAPVVTTSKKRTLSPLRGPDGNQCLSWREALGPQPEIGPEKETFQKWLSYHKKKWRFMLDQRKMDARMAKSVPCTKTKTMGVGHFLKKAQRTILSTYWQIIQIVESSTPGLFHFWILIGNELHSVKVNVRRTFYVNQRTPKTGEGELWKKANRLLPRSHPVFNLYEYSVPEEVYKEHRNDLLADLSTPDVEGIYETHVPLIFRVLVQVGCVCAVGREHVRHLAAKDSDTFDLSQLEFKTLAQYSYLPAGSIKYIFLYQFSAGNKAMYGLFFPTTKKAYVFVVDTVKSNQMPNMAALYNNERNEKISRGEQNEENIPEQGYTFEVTFEIEVRNVYRAIQRHLQVYKNEKRGPTVISAQTLFNFQRLVDVMPGISEFPVTFVHVTDHDQLYNVLDWQRIGAKALIGHFLNLDHILSTMIEHSRYFHVPLGNLPQDTTLFGADLFFARHLKLNNYLWWCSNTERPDLGGKEADDNRLFAEFEENAGIELNEEGAYNAVCIELDIDSLAVNALLQCHLINDLEGTSNSVAFNALPQVSLEDMVSGIGPAANLLNYDETALCYGAFRILRSMVQSWIKDLTVHNNAFADCQIIHFYRWLRSPEALFYEPALRKILHGLMKKLFLQLVSDFRRLGATVIYADFTRILVCTKKRDVVDGLSYADYIVNHITSKEIYHSLNVVYKQGWQYLLWLSAANHGGIKAKLDKNIKRKLNVDPEESYDHNEETNELDDDEDEDGPTVEMNWNLLQYLPEVGACQEHFTNVIANYIMTMFKNIQLTIATTSNGSTPVRKIRRIHSSQSQVKSASDPEDSESVLKAFAKEFVSGEFAHKLFLITERIHKKFPRHVEQSIFYHQSEPSNENVVRPALELVKAVCKVLSLDPAISEEVTKLRRNLFRIIGVGEFSEEATWRDPCISYILPEVISKACNHCRDLDLCKDGNIVQDINGRRSWQCPVCQNSYSTSELESLLIDRVHKKSMAYVLQDIKCSKCQEVKLDNISKHCTCAGSYDNFLSLAEFGRNLKIFKNIAKEFEMPMLEEQASFLLDMNSWV